MIANPQMKELSHKNTPNEFYELLKRHSYFKRYRIQKSRRKKLTTKPVK